jgi:hypothetical protein
VEKDMKELPHAIAPDGEVITIKRMRLRGTELATKVVCPKCYMNFMCRNSADIERVDDLLGVACIDYDRNDGDELAYWRKV